MEARGFRDAYPEFQAKGVKVFGVSKDTPAKLASWKAREGLPFDLLSDDGTLCERFGAWREKKNYGRTYMGIARITVLLDEQGNVAKNWDPVKVAGHAKEVLAALG